MNITCCITRDTQICHTHFFPFSFQLQDDIIDVSIPKHRLSLQNSIQSIIRKTPWGFCGFLATQRVLLQYFCSTYCFIQTRDWHKADQTNSTVTPWSSAISALATVVRAQTSLRPMIPGEEKWEERAVWHSLRKATIVMKLPRRLNGSRKTQQEFNFGKARRATARRSRPSLGTPILRRRPL